MTHPDIGPIRGDDSPATNPMHERIQRVVEWVGGATHSTPVPISEHEFLYGESPHPKTVAHTAAVVERIQALKPPSLVRMDRAEALVAAVVIWRNRELHGQAPGEEQYDSALDYIRDLTDRYIEAAS